MRHKLFPYFLFSTSYFLAFSVSAAQPAPEGNLFNPRYREQVFPVLVRYCNECHSSLKKKGGVRLDEIVDATKFQSDIEKWQKVLEQVTYNQMPPEEKPRPKAADIDILTQWISDSTAWADGRRAKDPGYVLPQRMNCNEYNNTARDLTGLTVQPADSFPTDDSGYGFDNIADVLTMSPLLAEKYLDAAELIVETGFGKAPEVKAGAGVGDIADARFTAKGKKEDLKIEAGTLTFYGNAEATFSLDCVVGTEYELKMLAYQQKAGDEAAALVMRLDGKELATVKVEALKARPQALSHKFKATAVKHEIGLAFTNDFLDQKTKADRNLYLMQVKVLGQAAPVAPAPLYSPPAFAKLVLIAAPAKAAAAEERVAAEAIIKNFATRAFRRPAFP